MPAAMVNKVVGYYNANANKPNRKYGCNWFRVLIAFGARTADQWPGTGSCSAEPYTVAEALRSETVWRGWKPVRQTLERIEAAENNLDIRSEAASLPGCANNPRPTPQCSILAWRDDPDDACHHAINAMNADLRQGASPGKYGWTGNGPSEWKTAGISCGVAAKTTHFAGINYTNESVKSVAEGGGELDVVFSYSDPDDRKDRDYTVIVGGTAERDRDYRLLIEQNYKTGNIAIQRSKRKYIEAPRGAIRIRMRARLPFFDDLVSTRLFKIIPLRDNDPNEEVETVVLRFADPTPIDPQASDLDTRTRILHYRPKNGWGVQEGHKYAVDNFQPWSDPGFRSYTLSIKDRPSNGDTVDGLTLTLHSQTVSEGHTLRNVPLLSAQWPKKLQGRGELRGLCIHGTLTITPRSNGQPGRQDYSVSPLGGGADWPNGKRGGSFTTTDMIFCEGETGYARPIKRYNIYGFSDSHNEGSEVLDLTFGDVTFYRRNDRGQLKWIQPPSALTIVPGTITITNDGPLPKEWMARFGRTVAQQALDGIAGRMTTSRMPGAQGTIAGQPFNLRAPGADGLDTTPSGTPFLEKIASLVLPDLARGFDADGARFGLDGVAPPGVGGPLAEPTLTLRDALLGSSFTATGQPDAHGGSFAFWGRAAQANFDGREGAVALDGEVTTGLLGVDYARDQWLAGVSLLQSTGTGGYTDTGSSTCPEAGSVSAELRTALCQGAGRAGNGAVETTLTAAVPYASLQAAERLQLWGAAGYGWGDIRLETGLGETLRTDVTWSMATLGLRGQVLAPTDSGPALAVTSDALWAGTDSEQIRGLEASDSDVTRLRLGLEGSWLVRLDTFGQLTPTLAVGARHDGGDAETGFGVELGGGLAWNAPRFGVALNLEGRTLLTHRDEDFQDQGVAASFAFDPDPATPRGPSLTVRQDWGGRATGGVDALFAAAPLTQRPGTTATSSRWAAEAAWGFPAFEGRFTGSPHLGVGLATGTRDYRLGWRLVPATTALALSLDLQATRRELDAAQPEHTVGLEVTTRW